MTTVLQKRLSSSLRLCGMAALVCVVSAGFSPQASAQSPSAAELEASVENLDVDEITDQIKDLQDAIAKSDSPTEKAELQEELDILEENSPEKRYVYEGNEGAFAGAEKPKRVFNNVGRKVQY